MKSCRDRLIISSGFQEKGGCPIIRACSAITSDTVTGLAIYILDILFTFNLLSYTLGKLKVMNSAV